MLYHRLAPEGQASVPPVDQLGYSVEPCRCLNIRAAAAALLVCDLAAFMLFGFAMPQAAGEGASGSLAVKLVALALPVALWLFCAHATALYDQAKLRSGKTQGVSALVTVCAAFAPMVSAAWLIGAPSAMLARGAEAFVAQLCAVLALRAGWFIIMRALLWRGFCLETAVILAGSLSTAHNLAATIERRTRGRLRAAVTAAIPRQGDASALVWLQSLLLSRRIDRFVLDAPEGGLGGVPEWLVTSLRDGADLTQVEKNRAVLRYHTRAVDLPFLDETAPPLSDWDRRCKRLFDLVLSAAALIVLTPLMLSIAILIRLDSKGPVLFRQLRAGLNGRAFSILKFRSMYADMTDATCAVQTSRDDPRVTRIGHVLRVTSLDELPQLINVLRGDMSLIGPRPHALGMTVEGRPVAKAIEDYEARLRMRPGITGWAQVNGSRGEVGTAAVLRRRVALDCYYIENWSLPFDIRVLFRTLSLIFFDDLAF